MKAPSPGDCPGRDYFERGHFCAVASFCHGIACFPISRARHFTRNYCCCIHTRRQPDGAASEKRKEDTAIIFHSPYGLSAGGFPCRKPDGLGSFHLLPGGVYGHLAGGIWHSHYFVGNKNDAYNLADYKGMFWNRPWLAALFTAMLLSLAGIPLTAGFVGKFYVLMAGVNANLWWLVIVLVAGSAIRTF